MEAPEAASGFKRKLSFNEKTPAPQQNTIAAPTPANVRRKRHSSFRGQNAMVVPLLQPPINPSTVPHEVLVEQRQGQVQPGSRRPSGMEPPEGQAYAKPTPYYGVIAFNDAVEPQKARGPQAMNAEKNAAHAATPHPQHPHNDRRDGASMLPPAYMCESLYEDENRNMTTPCMFCALMPLFAIAIGVIFFLPKSSQLMAALERTTTMTTTATLTTRPSHGPAMHETTTFVDNGGTSPGDLVPSVTDDRLSSEEELDDAKASNMTTTCGDVE
ncbi:hypothetical protein MTO96_027732 [Rhipicephalus appendiculatus]